MFLLSRRVNGISPAEYAKINAQGCVEWVTILSLADCFSVEDAVRYWRPEQYYRITHMMEEPVYEDGTQPDWVVKFEKNLQDWRRKKKPWIVGCPDAGYIANMRSDTRTTFGNAHQINDKNQIQHLLQKGRAGKLEVGTHVTHFIEWAVDVLQTDYGCFNSKSSIGHAEKYGFVIAGAGPDFQNAFLGWKDGALTLIRDPLASAKFKTLPAAQRACQGLNQTLGGFRINIVKQKFYVLQYHHVDPGHPWLIPFDANKLDSTIPEGWWLVREEEHKKGLDVSIGDRITTKARPADIREVIGLYREHLITISVDHMNQATEARTLASLLRCSDKKDIMAMKRLFGPSDPDTSLVHRAISLESV